MSTRNGACVNGSDGGIGGRARVVVAGGGLDKGAEDAGAAVAGLFDAVTESDDVYGDVVLLEFLGEADEGVLVRVGAFERGADEDDDALAEVLVLAVLEGELGDGDGGGGKYTDRAQVLKGCRWAASLRSEQTERTRVWYSCRRVDTYICVLYGLLYDGSGDMKKEAAGDEARRTDTPLHG